MHFPSYQTLLIGSAGALMMVSASPARLAGSHALDPRAPQPLASHKHMLKLARAGTQAVGQPTDLFSWQTGMKEEDFSCWETISLNSNLLSGDSTMQLYPDEYDSCEMVFQGDLTTSVNNPARNWFTGHDDGYYAGIVSCKEKGSSKSVAGSCFIIKDRDGSNCPARSDCDFCNSSNPPEVEIRCSW